MKPFTDSNACRSRAHCQTCRDGSSAGESWRRSVTERFRWDEARTCPIGLKIGEPVPATIEGAPPAQPLTPAQEAERVRRVEEAHTLSWLDAARRVRHGLWEQLKTKLGIGVAAVDVARERREVCRACPKGLYTPCGPGLSWRCCGELLSGAGRDMNNPGCGCWLGDDHGETDDGLLNGKWARADAVCPHGYW